MRYYLDEYVVAEALRIPKVSLINISGNIPAILAGTLSFTVTMREHDAVYCEWEGDRYYAVLYMVTKWNGSFQFLWSGSPGMIGAKPDGTVWRDSPLRFGFREVRFTRGFMGMGPRLSYVHIGTPPPGMCYQR